MLLWARQGIAARGLWAARGPWAVQSTAQPAPGSARAAGSGSLGINIITSSSIPTLTETALGALFICIWSQLVVQRSCPQCPAALQPETFPSRSSPSAAKGRKTPCPCSTSRICRPAYFARLRWMYFVNLHFTCTLVTAADFSFCMVYKAFLCWAHTFCM